MQFPVPQFTEVEDKIIGPLTVKQFLILVVTAGVIFFCYSLTKDYYVTGAAFVLAGIPGLAIAFGQFNGRPMYASITVFLNYWTRPKFFTFQKQAASSAVTNVKDLEQKPEVKSGDASGEDAHTRLKKIQYQLEQRAKQEAELLGVPGKRSVPGSSEPELKQK
jgi:hypothetical protein